MDWKTLLSGRRLGSGSAPEPPPRSRFQRDYDRVVFSSHFRRLHGKTQVFPLPSSDVTHTRLSHSLEAACVARSLGAIAATQLGLGDQVASECAEVLSAAALAHDIGNPPFGHSGEDAIGHFFATDGRKFTQGLTLPQVTDLEKFEGNALGFRLLAQTNPRASLRPGGLQLTVATLAAFSKYPRSSYPPGDKTKASEKKFGYFQAETDLFKEVAEGVGLVRKSETAWTRHPLAFLLEAADDICYSIIDLEDAYRLDIVTFDRAAHLLQTIADADPHPVDEQTLRELVNPDEQIGYLRAKAINNLVHEAVDVFLANREPILSGQFDETLMSKATSVNELAEIKRESYKNVFPHRPVVEIEAAGFGVIGGLLQDFVSYAGEHPMSRRAEKVLSLLPDEIRPQSGDLGSDQYGLLLRLAQYVAGMTDEFAIRTYRVLRGIELPRS